MPLPIAFAPPHITEEDGEAVVTAVRSDWITTGREVITSASPYTAAVNAIVHTGGSNVTLGDIQVNAVATMGRDAHLGEFECHILRGPLLDVRSVTLQRLTVDAGGQVGPGACMDHNVARGIAVVGLSAWPLEEGHAVGGLS